MSAIYTKLACCGQQIQQAQIPIYINRNCNHETRVEFGLEKLSVTWPWSHSKSVEELGLAAKSPGF